MWKPNHFILLLCLVWAAGGSNPKQRIGFTLENQFRKEITDGEGGVLGEYGMRTGDGCLRVTKYRATPTGGFKVLSTHKEDCDPRRQFKALERAKKPVRKQAEVSGEPLKTSQRADVVLPGAFPSPPSILPPSPVFNPPASLPFSPPPSPLSNLLPSPPLSLISNPPPSEPRPLVPSTSAAAAVPQPLQSEPGEPSVPAANLPPETVGGQGARSTPPPTPPPSTPGSSSGAAPAKSPRPKSPQSPDRTANLPKQLKKEFDYDSLSGDARARILDKEDDPVYSFGFTAPGHGHTQAGLPDGTKKGEYYFDSPDGWRRIVTYEANENGFFPKMRRIRIPGWIPPPPPPRRVRNRDPPKGDGQSDRPEGGDEKRINRNGPDSGPDGGSDGGSVGGPDDKSDGGPDGKSDGGPNGKPDGGPNGGLDSRPNGGPDGRPDNRPDGKPDDRPDGRPDNKPDGKPDDRPDGRPDGKLDPGSDGIPNGQSDGVPHTGPGGGNAQTDVDKERLDNGDHNRDHETGKQLLEELKGRGGVGSCPYYFFYSTKVNFHWERCLENGTKVGQYGKLHEDGYSYRTSYYADHTGYHPTSTKTFLTDQQRALVHDFVRGVFIIPQVDEERKQTEERILRWLGENAELLDDPLRELAAT